MTTTSETEERIPCTDTADFDADVLLRIEGDLIFFEVDDIRGRGARGYLTPDQARQTAAALGRIATTLDHAADPGARRDRVARELAVTVACYREVLRDVVDPADEAYVECMSTAEQHLGDDARGRIEDVPVGYRAVKHYLAATDRPAGSGPEAGELCPDCTGSGIGLTLPSGETWPCRQCAGTGIARAAASEGEPFAVGDVVRLRDGVLPSLTVRVGPLREVATDRAEAIVDLGDGGQLWVQFREFVRVVAGTGPEGSER